MDVVAMDEDKGEDFEEDTDIATDVDVNLVEEMDEESLVDDAADVIKGSSADEVVSDAPASPFARSVDEVTAHMNQICQIVSTARKERPEMLTFALRNGAHH